MNKANLIESAKKLSQPTDTATAEYSQKMERIAAEVNSLMKARPDLDRLIGPDNVAMMEDNHRNFARFTESLFLEFNPEVLVETVIWAISAYKAHGFKLTYWPAELDKFIEVLRGELSPEAFESIHPIYKWITVNIPICLKLSEEYQQNPDIEIGQ